MNVLFSQKKSGDKATTPSQGLPYHPSFPLLAKQVPYAANHKALTAPLRYSGVVIVPHVSERMLLPYT